jgi:lipopolysaccharide/colanic/teichoic acid biosynthesis glycosyltransferase
LEGKLALMPLWKRIFDIVGVLVLAVPLVPVMAVTALIILLRDGRPVFFVSERMRTAEQGFALVKFRTMRPDMADSGVSGGDKTARITHTGAFLRRTRLDELPQLWNILMGDMSFVGPRPPLRRYVVDYPGLYRRVLRARPGVTGLATVIYHRHEERLLRGCTTAAQTDVVYRRACIPRKARLDLIYLERQSLALDLWIIFRTLVRRKRRN